MKKYGKKEKIKKNIKERTDLILFLLFCAFTLSLTVGYAALGSDLTVSGEAAFRVEEDIRITNVELSETTNMGIENYENKYGKDSITLGVDLKEINSSVTYNVQIVNKGSVSMWIESITQEINNNTNMEYVLEGIGIKELINPGDVIDFKLTIKYKDNITLPSNTNLDTMLRFEFVKPESILAQGNNGSATSTFYNGTIKKESVESIEFLPTIEVGEGAIGYWDASFNKDGTVIAWYTDSDSNDLYELYIGGVGEIKAPVNSSYLFNNFNNAQHITFSDYFNTIDAVNMIGMFEGNTGLLSLDLSKFNTSNVTQLYSMFAHCELIENLDLSSFNTSKVTDFQRLFTACYKLKNLNVKSFDTQKSTSFYSTFSDCRSLVSLDISNFNTSNVVNFGGNLYGMFYNCNSLRELDLSNFDTGKAKQFNGMFAGCSSLTSLDLSSFDTSSATDFSAMFSGCTSLTSLDLSNFDTSKVQNMRRLFMNCSNLYDVIISNKFNTGNVTDMNRMFYGATVNLDFVYSLDTFNVTDMSYMFSYSLYNELVLPFDTSNLMNMEGMFMACYDLMNLDLTQFFTGNVNNMSRLFCDCKLLEHIDLSNFDTIYVTDMSYMFYGCSSLLGEATFNKNKKEFEYTFDISNLITDQVTNMSHMFENCTKLYSADFTNFNTDNVEDMSYMFAGCNNLILNIQSGGTINNPEDPLWLRYSLDFSGLDTPNLTNVSYMFDGCTSLNMIGLNSMKFDKVTEYENMFRNTPNLESVVVGADYITRMEQIVEQSGSSASVGTI